ncbi:MAG: hypothetical protein QOD65_1439 [Gaiellales bacterium]|nr:hypothetical protein [Gaiellales bacterium]
MSDPGQMTLAASATWPEEGFEALLRTLLWEGYALYPYTRGTAKNATPTPFGIVYPPAYAATVAAARDNLALRGLAHAGADAAVTAELRFLQAGGSRHEAVERRVAFAPRPLAAVAAEPSEQRFSEGGLEAVVRLSARSLEGGEYAVELRVENSTAFTARDGGRAEALASSLLSTLPFLRLGAGRFASPLDPSEVRSENTFPVLATEADDTLLGATIVLPEHPQIAPESRGDLFDGTEIEEALLLHVLALSDDERASIARDDPAVRAMIERAAAATPAEILALHGRMTLTDPHAQEAAP